MTFSLTPREHVLISYAILFVLVAIVGSFALRAPVAQRASYFAQLSDLRSVHARSVQSIRESEGTRAALARAASRVHADADFLQAETDALAAADLQNAIKIMVEAESGTLISSAFRRSTEPLPVTPVTVVVRLRCSVEALTRILYALEQHTPALFTEDVSIQSRHGPGRLLRDVNEELDVELNVTGYLNRVLAP